MNNNYSLVDIDIEYIDELLVLEKRIFPDPWNKDMFINEMYSNLSSFKLLLNENKEVIAYFGLWTIQDEGHINNLAVDLSYYGKGIGDFLMNEIFKIGDKNNINVYYLEVRSSNKHAINLYKRHGFFEAGRRKNYYKNPKEDALLMTKLS